MKRTLVINGVLGLALAGGGVTAYLMVQGDKPATAASVRTVAAQQGTVTATVAADGAVESASTMSAAFSSPGTVTAIKVKLGEVVKKGAVLATLDSTEAKANLTTAKRNLESAEDALDRATGTAVESAENQVEQAEDAVDSAQRKVDATILKAPMTGTVVVLSGAVGGVTTEFQLADLTKLQVKASVPEADATRLKAGQAATLTWNALSNTTADGLVTSISPTAATGNVVAYPITISITNKPDGVRLGQSVKMSVTVEKAENVVFVPAAAVRSAGNRSTVTVVKDGVQETRIVQIGLKGDTFTVVTSGLTAGEQVVLATTTSGTNTNQIPQLPGGGGQFPGGGGGRQGGGGGPQ